MSATQSEIFRPFGIEVIPGREAVRVCPCGEVDIATVGLLRERVDDLESSGFARLVLDLGEVTFLDLTGARLIVELAESARANGCELVVIEGCAEVRHAFERTGLRPLVPLAAVAGEPSRRRSLSWR